MKNIKNNKIYSRPITHHAKERTLERTDYSIAELKNKSKTAFKHGYKIRSFSGELYDYLYTKQIRGANYIVRVFENNIYIFDAQLKRMITIYPVPEEYLPVENYLHTHGSPCIILVSVDGHWEYVCEGTSETNFLTMDIALATEFRTIQKAQNYIKNNNWISVMCSRGYEFKIMEL